MKILIVDDERNIRESIERLFSLEGIDSVTAENGKVATEILERETFDAILLDLKMPVMDGQKLLEWLRAEGIRSPTIMISALGDINDAVRALKSGATDYLIKPFDPAELIHKVRAIVRAQKQEDLVEAEERTAVHPIRFIGHSPAAREILARVAKVAGTNATVLITGESGTGKEVIAREIHALSPNSSEPFVPVNTGALPEQLIESELFGHEKGAFTGADSRKPGLFELAGSGTLFLDEIGDMPFALQVKLLRVLQERKTRRLGGMRDIPIHARIISATNRDIESEVKMGHFREDLYYRLNVVRIEVPPLRERKEDIPELAIRLISAIRSRSGGPKRHLSPDAIIALTNYDFPGNIRELENILERALLYGEVEELTASDLDLPTLRKAVENSSPESKAFGNMDGADLQAKSLENLERSAIIRSLAKWGGNRSKAAEELGISRRTILNKIKRYSIGD